MGKDEQVTEKKESKTTRKILIIDDDRLILQSLSAVFIKNAWDVETCQSAPEGIRRIEAESHDCILLDIRMPDLEGTQVMEQLRELERQGRIGKQNVIIMTGYADEPAWIKAFQLGAFSYVQKPFDVKHLLEKVKQCVDSSEVKLIFDVPPVVEEEADFKKLRKLYDADSVKKKADLLSRQLEVPLRHIRGCTYDTNYFKGNIENAIGIIQIPLGIAGPIMIQGKHAVGDFWVPMATTEGALVLTYDLGMRLLRISGPIEVNALSNCVHITPMFAINNDEDVRVGDFVDRNFEDIKRVAQGESRHTTLLRIEKSACRKTSF